MLSEREEQFLRNQIRDNTAMRPVNPMPPRTGFEPLVPDAEIERWRNEPKMRPIDLNDDYSVESKIHDAGFKGKPGEFYATIGLNRQQTLAMSKGELKQAIERAKSRDDVAAPHTNFSINPEAKPEPRRGASILV